MEIFPAIDIKGGQVVRLTQGDYDKVDVYSNSPAEIAKQFKQKGARNLHMVDLDGARDGLAVNVEPIKKVVEQGGLFTQLGGGIRSEEQIARYLDIGIGRVILGTAALENFSWLTEMVKKYAERIAVGVDARDGKVAVKGWFELTDVDSIDFCKRLEDIGVRTIIYTDISRDGMGVGTNLEIYKTLSQAVNCDIVASGGISFMNELKALSDAKTYGAIVGKALYTGTLDLEEVLNVCK